uniref:Uncharacterized protein n=1 Tax=Opuntia streptacantha TaxID=393608 RepID=A0A7C9EU53_OPUST
MLNRTSSKYYNSLLLLFVLAMFEGQLCHLNPGCQIHFTTYFQAMHASQYFSKVTGWRDQNTNSFPSHGQNPHCILRIRLSFSTAYEIDSICLSLKPICGVIPIAHPFRIVDADHRRLEHHG